MPIDHPSPSVHHEKRGDDPDPRRLVPYPIHVEIAQGREGPSAHLAGYLGALAILGSSMDRFATEIRHLARTEVGEVEEPFGKQQKGSSAMPRKRNPITCERVSGMARLLRGNLVAALENMPLWHERDISHSSVERVIGPDSTILIDFMLHRLGNIVQNLVVYPERMLENLRKTGGLSQVIIIWMSLVTVSRRLRPWRILLPIPVRNFLPVRL